MRHLRFRPVHLAVLLLSLFFHTKMRRVAEIQSFLAEQSGPLNDPQQMAEHKERLYAVLRRVQKQQKAPPAFLLLNKFALNISLNFICNLHRFPAASERLIAVVFDHHSRAVLQRSFPKLNVLHWHLPALEEKFGAGDGRYQLFQYFRARLAVLLTELTDSFWMVQADTIWRENLFDVLDLESAEFNGVDLALDSEGDEGLLRSMVAGGYFFVRSSARTKQFFESIARFLLDHFSTDNNVMTRQCVLGLFNIRCAQIPYNMISNWRNASGGGLLFQFDGGDGTGTKFEKMRAQGFIFVEMDSMRQSTKKKGPVKCKKEDGKKSIGREFSGHGKRRSDGEGANRLLAFVHRAFEWIHGRFPELKEHILGRLFPYYAAYLFI